MARSFAKSISEHLTGNYNIGTGEVDFEELSEYAETISSIVGYSDESE